MNEIEGNKTDSRFYGSLKNSQPIVFMASFSMIIAVFSYSNKEISGVYNSAVLASIMFLISFVFSLMDQIFPKDKKEDNIWRSGGKYFFFAVGIFYLLVIAYEFSKPLPEVFTIILSWAFIAIGIPFFTPVFFKKGKFSPSLYAKKLHHLVVSSIGYVTSLSLIGVGFVPLVNIFTGSKISIDSIMFFATISFVSALCFMGLEFALITTFLRMKKRANTSSKDESKSDL